MIINYKILITLKWRLETTSKTGRYRKAIRVRKTKTKKIMYCRNCGNEVSEKAVMCVACGTPPKSGNKYCYNCKAETSADAVICMKCGVSLKNDNPIEGEGKDWLTALLLCLFLGGLGIHRFYTKHTVIGVIQLLTLGGCGIWALIDLIMIIIGSYKDADGNKLVKR